MHFNSKTALYLTAASAGGVDLSSAKDLAAPASSSSLRGSLASTTTTTLSNDSKARPLDRNLQTDETITEEAYTEEDIATTQDFVANTMRLVDCLQADSGTGDARRLSEVGEEAYTDNEIEATTNFIGSAMRFVDCLQADGGAGDARRLSQVGEELTDSEIETTTNFIGSAMRLMNCLEGSE